MYSSSTSFIVVNCQNRELVGTFNSSIETRSQLSHYLSRFFEKENDVKSVEICIYRVDDENEDKNTSSQITFFPRDGFVLVLNSMMI